MPDRLLYSFLAGFPGGVNSDVAPILLPADVASWTINATLRGGFARPRPPLFLRTLTYPSLEVQDAVETGFFQGGGYYRPDFGPAQLVAQISGRQFTFTESGSSWTVAEITIPGDPNDATTSQVWMNQAEKWLIISDGSAKLPIFYDGVSARRSYGPSVNLGTANAFNPGSPPAIGETVEVTLVAPWTGPFNVAVLMNGEFYQTVASNTPTPQYDVILTNISGNPGDVVPAGSVIETRPGYVGYLYRGGSSIPASSICPVADSPTNYGVYLPLATASASLLAAGSRIVVGGYTVQVVSIDPPAFGQVLVFGHVISPTPAACPGGGFTIPIGTLVQFADVTDPNVLIGTTLSPYNIPAMGATVTATIDALYSGAAGVSVWVGDNQYTIEAAPPPAPSTTLYLVNLSDTDTNPYSATEIIQSVPELPAGRMGAYGLGHEAWCLTDGISFIYGDTVGGPSGTQAYNYRDAVLKTTENTFLEGGGSFRIPNSGEIITSMTFTAILDAAYGQGPLEIGTPTSIFTCAVPTDRATWIALTNPVLTQALIGKGPLAQNSTILANSDTLFRSSEGLGSLIFGRRNFETWGNTPISTEMNRTIQRDLRSLLSYGSAVTFDNRLLSTAAPQVSGQGVFHIGTLALNFDPVSSLRGKAPSIWESLWTGTNVLQYISGIFNSVERCFQFTLNQNTSRVELFEQLRSDSGEYFDNGTDRIEWVVETPAVFKPEEREPSLPIVRLWNGKIQLAEVVGTVRIRVLHRPDFYPCWTLWREFDVCATVDSDDDDSQPGYRTEVGFGEPSGTPCEAANNRPLRCGRFHQLRLEITGQCVITGITLAAVPEPTINFPPPICNV